MIPEVRGKETQTELTFIEHALCVSIKWRDLDVLSV